MRQVHKNPKYGWNSRISTDMMLWEKLILTAGVSQFVASRNSEFIPFIAHSMCQNTQYWPYLWIFYWRICSSGATLPFQSIWWCSVQAIKNKKSHKVLPDNLYNDFDFIGNIISPSRSRLSVPMIATAFKKKKLFEISQKWKVGAISGKWHVW